MNFKPLYMLLLIFMMGACSGAQEGESQKATAATSDEIGGVKKVGSVVDGYLKLKDALVASNVEDAQEYSVAMMEVVDAIAMPEIQQAIKDISASDDINEQRKAFESFSTYLYKDLKSSDKQEQTLYKQYCPMAFNNQGAFWLSAQKEIRNPYFGDDMLTCGRVEEELPVSN